MKKFDSKSCEEIMTTVYNPIEFVVDNMIAQWFYILAKEALASTFEDCLVYTNFQLFKDMFIDDAGSLVKKVSDKIKNAGSFDEFHKDVYDLLRNGKSDQKAEFALDLIYAVDPSELTIPEYIAEGLEWLQSYLRPEE